MFTRKAKRGVASVSYLINLQVALRTLCTKLDIKEQQINDLREVFKHESQVKKTVFFDTYLLS